jgi:glycosyltransferase involved in cell wall biosynthesis
MTDRIKVAHIIESLGRGGAERVLVTNLAHIDRRRFENHVIYLFDGEEFLPDLEALGIPSYRLGMRNFYDWRGFWRLRQTLKTVSPDIVHTVLQKADIYGRIAAASAGFRPILSTLHECPYNPEVFIDNPVLNRFRYGVFKWLDRSSARWCNDGFLVASQNTQKTLRRYFGVKDSRMRLLYNSIDLDRFDGEGEADVDHVRRELGLTKDDVVLLNIARLAPQKGQQYLIRAMVDVCRVLPNAKLIIRGEGPLRSDLNELVRSLGLEGKVLVPDRFGSPDEVLALFRLCDVFVFPSLYEGFGVALVEAMALEKPCVASNAGPIPEVVQDGRSGVLVEPMDPGALATAIVNLVTDPDAMRAMGRAGRKIVEQTFDIRQTVKQLEATYEEFAERAAAH